MLSKKNPQLKYEKVKSFSKLKTCSNGCIKGKDGSIIIDRKEIITIREEYIGELYDDEDGGVQLEICKSMNGPLNPGE